MEREISGCFEVGLVAMWRGWERGDCGCANVGLVAVLAGGKKEGNRDGNWLVGMRG